jgi:hypothetical protein
MASRGCFSWGRGGEWTGRGVQFLWLTVHRQEWQVVDIERSLPQATTERDLVP